MFDVCIEKSAAARKIRRKVSA